MATILSDYEIRNMKSMGIPVDDLTPEQARVIYGKVMSGTPLAQALSYAGVSAPTQNPTGGTTGQVTGATDNGNYQEGDSRTNPQTGQQEFLSPDGTWQPVTAPGQTYGTENQIPPGGTQFESTGDNAFDTLLGQLQTYLDKLAEQGKALNPAVIITPEKTAEFMAQASTEIDPYYSTQLKLASDTLLRGIGYSTEDITRFEADTEKKYGKSVQALGESMAEKGFAQSGQRQVQEGDLAYNTQQQIDENRRQLSFAAANDAATFAQNWGSNALGTPTISNAPTVKSGELSFAKPTGVSNLYTLNPDVYSNLVGTQQFNQTAAKRSRAAELEGAFRTTEENRLRSLQL